jgi:ATP-dependent exoDNAse (exonuclease V) beta subunit
MAADARGILVHALLERLDFRHPVTPSAEAIVAAARRAGIVPSPTPDEAAELAALIEAFGAGELRARLARARDLRREERFAFVLSSGVLVAGAIDVLAYEPSERMLIVDYKSDRLRGEQPAAIVGRAYGTQRLVYALAALRAGAAAVEVVHCFLERPGEPVAVTFASSDMERLERELEALAEGVVNGRFEVSPAPHRGLCAGCPAEGGLCSWPLELTRRQSPDQLF